MGTIRTAITLFDGVTDPLKRMHRAMGIVLNTFETMQRTSGRAVDTAAIRQAREEWARAGAGFDAVEQNIRDAEQAQQRLNDTVSEGASGVDNLVNKIKGIVTAYAGVEGMKKALDWTKTNLQMADTQRNAENQLRAVLANRGASEGSYDRLTANASAIQQAGMYGDEVMIGGTAELATYLKDTDALEHMMGTLTNYAAGMSGGGAVDYNQMVDYATQLGKALDGSYDGLKKKGFELSDAQKEIIENGTDMQKALVLDDVIGESWSNLYETMSNTPQGKIIQLENTWGDLQETMGNQLYPVVLHIVEAVTANWPKVETVMTSITGAVGRMVGVFGVLLNTGIHTANALAENWDMIQPLILGVVGALAIYYGRQVAANTITALSTGIHTATAVAQMVHAAATKKLTQAKAAEIAAQNGLNTALYACPITWIIMGIVAIIAVFYAAIAAVNKFAGTSISATGLICGAISAAGAFIGNLVIAVVNVFMDAIVWIYNAIAAFWNFVNNVSSDTLGSIVRLVADVVDEVLSLIQSLAGAIDAVFGKNLASSVQGWRDSLEGLVDKTFGKGKEVMMKMDAQENHLVRFEYSAAYNKGYDFGKNLADKASNLLRFNVGDALDGFDFGNALDGIYNNTADTAANTAATADSLDISEEDLTYLRDLAEREAINRFTTAEIKVEQHNENHISKDADLDGIMDAWVNDFAEKLEVSEEGVHE